MATPALIKVAYLKKLVDAPGEERKLHTRHIPTIGGVTIFGATLFAYLIWYPVIENISFKYIAASMMILFFIGVKDDIVGTAPIKKLLGHLAVAFILVFMAGIKITSLHGLFGIHQIPEWAGILLSVFTYTVVVNAFNLIDGIDGLAAGVGTIVCFTFGAWFYLAGSVEDAILAFALAGALLGFLIFNFAPARIFMGDSGSLLIGLIVAVLAIKIVEFSTLRLPLEMSRISKPIFAMAAIVYPMVDTLRIFLVRTIRGRSPFSADRNHLHHKLIDLGCTHRTTSMIIYGFTLFTIALAVFLPLEANVKFVVITVFVICLSQLLPFFADRHHRGKLASARTNS